MELISTAWEFFVAAIIFCATTLTVMFTVSLLIVLLKSTISVTKKKHTKEVNTNAKHEDDVR